MAAALALAVLDLFVGQHRAERRAPVDQGVGLVGQPLLVLVLPNRVLALLSHVGGNRQFGDRPSLSLFRIEPGVEHRQEDPLRPAEVVDVGGGQLAVPVVAETQHFQLAAEIGDVAFRGLPRRRVRLDRVLFGGQSEGVETHRVQNRFALHPSEPADDVGCRIAFRMPHVQAVAAGVGEHVQHVQLGPGRQVGRLERLVFLPVFLPFRFDQSGIVAWHERTMFRVSWT